MTTNRELLLGCLRQADTNDALITQIGQQLGETRDGMLKELQGINARLTGEIQWLLQPTITVETTEVVHVGTMSGMELVLEREPDGTTIAYLGHEGFEIPASEYEELRALVLAAQA